MLWNVERIIKYMKAICYTNTKMTIPGWVDDLSKKQPIGYAYELEQHFVHFYGSIDDNAYIIHPGLTVLQGKNGLTLEDWVKKTFGAENIRKMKNNVGDAVKGVWRPSLFYWEHINQAIDIDASHERRMRNSLRILMEKLDEVFLYIEPSTEGLESYSHKIRELLLLACTEMESYFIHYLDNVAPTKPLKGKYFTTNDYIKLKDKLNLDSFNIAIKNTPSINFNPFMNWDISKPTETLNCYSAYNKTKHNFDKHFDKATLKVAIEAVCGCLILYSVRFGLHKLDKGNDAFSTLFNGIFNLRLENPDITSFYIFKLNIDPTDTRKDLCCIGMEKYILPFNTIPLVL